MANKVIDIAQLVNAQILASYWENINRYQDNPNLGASLFPARRSNNTDLQMIKGTKGLPVVLQPSEFDTKAPLRDKMGITSLQYGMPFFREASQIGEKERQELFKLMNSGEEFVKRFLPMIYDQLTPLIEGAEARMEQMRMSVLSTGAIRVKASAETGRDVQYDLNFDQDGEWAASNQFELTGTDTWTEANADSNDPIADLLEIKDQILDETGHVPTRVLLNSTTLRNMLKSESLKKGMNPLYFDSLRFSRSELQSYVEQETGLEFIVYDKMFVNDDKETVKYYPDNQITLLPSGAVGSSVYGVTPEELDLLGASGHAANTAIVNPGIAVTTYREPHPVNIATIVSMVGAPSFDRMEEVFIVKVA